MDELEKKSEKGLNYYKKKGDISEVKSSLDDMIDGMFDEEPDELNDSPGEVEKKSNIQWIWMALAILLLCMMGYLGFKDGSSSKIKKETPQVIFAQYFEPMDDILINVERSSESSEKEQSEGMRLYNSQEFSKASELLLKSNDTGSQFYGAIATLSSGNYEKAVILFSNMQSNTAYSEYQDIIDWYHSLALIRSGNIKAAKKNLKSIIDNGSYKKTEALQVLAKLD